MTDPLDPRTFPNRTDTKDRLESSGTPAVSCSVSNFDLPRILVGSAALSVEMLTKRVTP